MSDALNNFTNGVKYLISTAIKEAPFDKTFNAKVTAVEDGKYTVVINGKEYTKTPALTDAAVRVGDVVKVVFPQNNYVLRYIDNAGEGGASTVGTVRYDTPQSLTEAQKAQARTNIGAGTGGGGGDVTGAVRYDAVQSLSDNQKTQARTNIGAYRKPNVGIPKADLAIDVQTSLDNADKSVRYTVQSLSDVQKAQARTNIGAYTKPANGITENDLSDVVKTKLNKTNIITIETEGTDPLNPYKSSKTLGAIKADFNAQFEQFVFYDNISYKLEKIITDNGVEKAVFYSTARLVNNVLTYHTCEIYDGEFGYSAADFHTYTISGGGAGTVASVNGQTGVVVLNASDVGAQRTLIPGSGITIIEGEDGDIIQSDASGGSGIISFVDTEGGAPIAQFTLNQMQDYEINVNDLTAQLGSKVNNLKISLSNDYRTAAAQDIIDDRKQDVIADLTTIRNGAAKGATALQSVPITYRTAAAQDALDAQKQHKLTAGANIAIDQSTNNISAVVPVKSVNNEIGSVYLDATNLKTTIPQSDATTPHEVEIYWDAFGDMGDMTVDGVTATRTNLNEAFGDGVKVNVNITFDGVTLLANPIVYGVIDDVLFIQCYASGYAYGDVMPVQFWLDVGNNLKSQIGSTLNNPMPLPTGSVYTIEQSLESLDNNKLDKTGGTISGNLGIDGALKLNIEDEDYDVDIHFNRRLDENRGTILTPQGTVSGTNYKVVIENVGTPVNDNDATTKKYVDDLCAITWIIGTAIGGNILVTSTAYNDAYNAVIDNKMCFMKIVGIDNVSILRLKAWNDFNYHSAKTDSFLFVDAVDADTNYQLVLTATGVTQTNINLEHEDRKVSSWTETPNDVNYPTEKLVKDNFDALKAYIDDQFKPHTIWEVEDAEDGITYSSGKSRQLSDSAWKLTGLNLLDNEGKRYARLKFYFRGCVGTVQDQEGAGVVLEMSLDDRFRTPRSNLFCATSVGYAINDNGVKAGVVANISVDDGWNNAKCATTYTNFNTTGTTALERDYRLYRIEAYKN